MSAAGRLPIALTIAGSDSGGGAGIQADLKTFAAHGVYAASVLTLVTAQSTSAVDAVHLLPRELVRQQLKTVCEDFVIGAAKTGALGSAELIGEVAGFLRARPVPHLVVDPVMVSKHGHPLVADDAVEALRSELLPLASVVTPNLPEAARLSGLPEEASRAWMLAAGRAILGLGCGAVVMKGGHRLADAADVLLTPDGEWWFESARLTSPHTHGTGCTYSAALTANLLRGLALPAACHAAKNYVAGAIRAGRVYGRGINPVEHFWQNEPPRDE